MNSSVSPELVEGPFYASPAASARAKSSPSTSSGPADLAEKVRTALANIYDPCSIAAGRPTSLVDMGLVLDARMDGATLHITFCVTFAGCTMAPHFVEAARVELLKIDGVERVETRVDTAHIWEPRPLVEMRGVPQAWRGNEAYCTHPSPRA